MTKNDVLITALASIMFTSYDVPVSEIGEIIPLPELLEMNEAILKKNDPKQYTLFLKALLKEAVQGR